MKLVLFVFIIVFCGYSMGSEESSDRVITSKAREYRIIRVIEHPVKGEFIIDRTRRDESRLGEGYKNYKKDLNHCNKSIYSKGVLINNERVRDEKTITSFINRQVFGALRKLRSAGSGNTSKLNNESDKALSEVNRVTKERDQCMANGGWTEHKKKVTN